MRCEWCNKEKKTMSNWQAQHLYKGWLRLCKPCASRKLRDPLNHSSMKVVPKDVDEV